MKQALLVIDVQESFRHRPYWQGEGFGTFIANVQSVVDRCRGQGIPVLQIFHQEEDGTAANPFSAASGHVRAMPELAIRPDAIFHKSVHSALFGRSRDGITLEQWLRHHRIEEVLVTGIRTEQCCETTARHSFDSGFAVRYVSDATLTFPMQSRSGRVFSTEDLRERTELVLEGRFARIVASAEALT